MREDEEQAPAREMGSLYPVRSDARSSFDDQIQTLKTHNVFSL